MAQIYIPDQLEFDFTGIVGSIGSGLLSAGKTLVTNILTKENVQTVVSGIVAKQVAKSQPKPTVTSGGVPYFQVPQQTFAPVPAVSTQPVIMSGGGGGYIPGGAAPAPSPFASINPLYIMGGMGLLALIMTRR